MTAYEALADLAERELELVNAGAVDRLSSIHEQRNALMATLPARPPATARPALERAARLQESVSARLQQRMTETGSELRRLTQGRTAMRGYAPPVEPLKLVDRAG
jgi:hypothetical protein